MHAFLIQSFFHTKNNYTLCREMRLNCIHTQSFIIGNPLKTLITNKAIAILNQMIKI